MDSVHEGVKVGSGVVHGDLLLRGFIGRLRGAVDFSAVDFFIPFGQKGESMGGGIRTVGAFKASGFHREGYMGRISDESGVRAVDQAGQKAGDVSRYLQEVPVWASVRHWGSPFVCSRKEVDLSGK
jgi:hypothetical protein